MISEIKWFFAKLASMKFEHLEAKPDIFGGKLCIKGTRISVQLLLEWLANGASKEEILKTYPQVTEAGFSEALQYMAHQSQNEVLLEVAHTA